MGAQNPQIFKDTSTGNSKQQAATQDASASASTAQDMQQLGHQSAQQPAAQQGTAAHHPTDIATNDPEDVHAPTRADQDQRPEVGPRPPMQQKPLNAGWSTPLPPAARDELGGQARHDTAIHQAAMLAHRSAQDMLAIHIAAQEQQAIQEYRQPYIEPMDRLRQIIRQQDIQIKAVQTDLRDMRSRMEELETASRLRSQDHDKSGAARCLPGQLSCNGLGQLHGLLLPPGQCI